MKVSRMILAIAIMAAMLSGKSAEAQYRGMESTVGVNTGASLINMLFRAFSYADEPGFQSSGLPVVGLSYDYRVTDWFSIGGAAAFSIANMSYEDPNTNQHVVDGDLTHFSAGFTRINIAARPLFYYVNGDIFEMYSGFRFGINIYNLSAKSDDPDFDELDPFNEGLFARGAAPGVQVILAGFNIFPVENIGINLEMAVGQPYFASLGVKYRF
jgi:hypothetical protein